MGGGASAQQIENSLSFHSTVQERSSHRRNNQDDARSYRSKIGAIKLILKNDEHREPFTELVESHAHGAILSTYLLLESLRKEVFEASKSHHLNEHVHLEVPLTLAPHTCSKEIAHLLEPLYTQVNDPSATYRLWIKTIGRVQESLLSLLFAEFEIYKEQESFQSMKMKSPTDPASPRMEQNHSSAAMEMKIRASISSPAQSMSPRTTTLPTTTDEGQLSHEIVRTASIVNTTTLTASFPTITLPTAA